MKLSTVAISIFAIWFGCFVLFPQKSVPFIIDETKNMGFCGTVPNESPYFKALNDSQQTGRELFLPNCARCHNPKLEKNLTGPALAGLMDRVPSREWVVKWIKNSASLIQSGDAYAVKIYETNGKAVMDPFPLLTDQEINYIIDFIEGYY